jgi:tetratricopeptide (TPR) repeat protein
LSAAGARARIAVLPLLFLLFCRSASARDSWEVAPGPADTRLPGLIALLEEARSEALAVVQARLGLEPKELPIRWSLEDSIPELSSGQGGVAHFQAGRTRVAGGAVEVVLPARRYLARPVKARAVVIHEAAHAVLASGLGSRERYEAVPAWFREGIALLVSGEGEERVGAEAVRSLLERRRPGAFLAGIGRTGREPATVPGPAESYLAVLTLTERLGDDGLRAFSRRIGAGAEFFDELSRTLGLTEPLLGHACLEGAARRLEEVLPESEGEALLAAIDLLGEARPAPAARLLQGLLEGGRAPALDATARYFLARARLAAGEPAAARDLLEGLVSGALEALWEPEALNLLGDARLALGDPAGARAAWEEALERFPEDRPVADRARRMLGRGLPAK